MQEIKYLYELAKKNKFCFRVTPPPVMWAQRNSVLFVTICLEDCANPTVKVEPEKLYFKGVGGTDMKVHEVTINFYKEIDATKTIQKSQGRSFEFVLTKKEEGPFWPRLTKENNKFHWLKSDFNKWKDEDDSEDEEAGGAAGGRDLEEVNTKILFSYFQLINPF